MRNHIRKWFQKYFLNKYTLACDISPFWTPINQEEHLFYYTGLLWARHKAKDWCRIHPNGQARIIPGLVYWDKQKLNKS